MYSQQPDFLPSRTSNAPPPDQHGNPFSKCATSSRCNRATPTSVMTGWAEKPQRLRHRLGKNDNIVTPTWGDSSWKNNQLVSEFNDGWCLKTVAAWNCLNCQWSPFSKSPTHVHNIVPTHHNPATLAMWQEFPLIVPKNIQIESIFNLTNHGDWTGTVGVSNLATPRSTPLELSEAIPALAKCLFVVIRVFFVRGEGWLIARFHPAL